MQNEQITKLEELKQDIEKDIEKAYGKDRTWFFSKNEKIEGYWGTQNIVFAALNPIDSGNRKSTDRIRAFFDNALVSNGFKNSHVTDSLRL